jgi:hypothetical protein
MRYFKRNARVTISQPAEGNQFFRQQVTNVTTVTDLRVTFTVEKSLEHDPNTCQLAIFNLAERTRMQLQRKPTHVRVEVAYDDQFSRLFEGDLQWAESNLDRVDWETRLQLGDGLRAYRHGRISKAYQGGATVKQLVTDTAKSMGLSLPRTVTEAKELQKQFANGVTLSGPAYREMTRLLKPLGKQWSIQDGRLQILGGSETRADDVIRIASDTGMKGSPSFGTPPDKKRPPILHVTTLCRPEITPGGRILVESKVVSGLFRVERVRHSGDTHSNVWDSDIEAIRL